MTAVQRARVPLGFLFGVVYLYFSRPQPPWIALGLGLSLAGLGLRFWASGYLEKGRSLARSGPYSRTRNPLYLGSFLMGLGVTLAGAVFWLLAAYLALFMAVYFPVMRREEAELQASFGEQFEEYRSRVPLFFPRLRATPPRAGETESCNFRLRQAILNGEHQTVLGFLIVSAAVIGKMLWN